jgi:hypothetical protein
MGGRGEKSNVVANTSKALLSGAVAGALSRYRILVIEKLGPLSSFMFCPYSCCSTCTSPLERLKGRSTFVFLLCFRIKQESMHKLIPFAVIRQVQAQGTLYTQGIVACTCFFRTLSSLHQLMIFDGLINSLGVHVQARRSAKSLEGKRDECCKNSSVFRCPVFQFW